MAIKTRCNIQQHIRCPSPQLTRRQQQVLRLDTTTYCAGMDFYVVLERPGYRVGRRRRAVSTVGIQHKVTKEDAMKW